MWTDYDQMKHLQKRIDQLQDLYEAIEGDDNLLYLQQSLNEKIIAKEIELYYLCKKYNCLEQFGIVELPTSEKATPNT